MIFDSLHESAQRGELLLIQDGFCHWHLRRDGQLTIREIIVTKPGQGIGTRILDTLRQTPGASCIVAKCPADLPSNGWYQSRGFVLAATERAKTGKDINVWRLAL